MKRSLALTGVALGVLAMGGCAGAKKASTIAASASAKAKARAMATPTASRTVSGKVRVGTYCSPAGVVARTTSGAWARCVKKQGETRARWAPAMKGGGGVAKAGQFCATEGATATSSTGVKLTCTKKRGETRARWRAK